MPPEPQQQGHGPAHAHGRRACGAAGLPLTSGKCYSAAFTDDVHLGIEEVQRRCARA